MTSTIPQPLDPRDRRVDSLATWALTTAAGLAFAVGAWQFNAMTSEVRAMRSDVSTLTTRIAVVEAARLEERVRTLEVTTEHLRALAERDRAAK